MFSVPLICSSSGVATVSATVSGLAPGNNAVTTTDGGTTSGYSEIGNCVIASRPARKIATEMTPAKIGRSIKNRDKFIVVIPPRGRTPQSIARGTAGLGIHRYSGRKPLQVVKDQALAGFDADANDTVAFDLRTKLNRAVFGLVVGVDDEDKSLALVVADRAFRNQQRVVERAVTHAHRNEHSGNQTAVGIGETRTGPDCAGAGIDPVVEALDIAAIDVSAVAPDNELHRNLLLCVLRLTIAAHIVEISLFIDFEIGVDAVLGHDGGEQRRRRRRRTDEIAERDLGAADAAGDRRFDIG